MRLIKIPQYTYFCYANIFEEHSLVYKCAVCVLKHTASNKNFLLTFLQKLERVFFFKLASYFKYDNSFA